MSLQAQTPMMLLENDTIAAISTPPGRGGIGIVRLSGPGAGAIAGSLVRLRNPLAAGRTRFAEVLDSEGALLDQAVVTFFASPRSATGEDVAEIAMHGSPVLLGHMLQASIAQGARLAEPGEFTQRAFLNGRLDLTQAEAVRDLIEAQTLQQARVAAAQLGGSLARTLAPIKQDLVYLIAELEAGVDFAEDDVDLLPNAAIASRLAALQASLAELASTYRYGRVLHEGFTIALVGQPNAGKSSLFNRLLGQERAIVTAQPGTTRDPIAEPLSLAGIPVRLIDTAGLRDTDAPAMEEPEREGIRRSRTTMAEADLVLHVVDATSVGNMAPEPAATALPGPDAETLASLEGRPHLLVLNKCDLLASLPTVIGLVPQGVLVSAFTGQGLEDLKCAAETALTGSTPSGDTAVITSLRQHQAIEEALTALARASEALVRALAHEFLLLDLYAALSALDSLTGATSAEAILERIFSTFCIGK